MFATSYTNERSSLWVPGLALAFLLLLTMAGCQSEKTETQLPDQIFFLAVDALSYERIDILLARGELPNFRQLIDGGARLEPKSIRPIEPLSAWSTALTGKLPKKHRHLGHLSQIPNGSLSVTPSSMRQTQHIWQLLSQNNVMSAGVGFPGTWPAETINGFLVSNVYTPTRWMETAENSFQRLVGLAECFPPRLCEEITPYVHDEEIVREAVARFFVLNEDEYGMIYDEPLGSVINKDNPLRDFAITYLADSSNCDVALYLQENYSPRFIGVYMELLQTLQSAFWPFAEPDLYQTPPENNRRFKKTIDEGYRLVDEQIGRWRERMTERSVLIVMSEHGFGTSYPPEDSERERKPYPVSKDPAVMLLYGYGIRDGVKIQAGSIADLVPTVLALFGKDVASDMDGSVPLDALEPSFLAAHPIRAVQTYDDGWPGPDRYPPLAGVSDPRNPGP
jgi:predicted AlkP superfamily phosphohydrolase/phosphomutase